ncbi:MAG: glycosyltransferase family 25 protein [Holosporaceae bacterium]|jgi:GR25 family glycosyltransferase involved in LPS biosynthesis|nr:glycosyltransferase family 25 protein [Holosporaceae bacterium]
MKNSLMLADDSKIIPGSISSYIINLARCPDRLNYVLPSVSQLVLVNSAASSADVAIPYQIVSAVDGRELSREQINYVVDEKAYRMRFKTSPEIGTIGCSLSHARCLEFFLKSNDEFALIFEDDVQFNHDELSDVLASLMKHKNLWDIVSFELNHHGLHLKIAALDGINRDSGMENYRKYSTCINGSHWLVIYLTNVKHAGAYLINRIAAQQLLADFFPIKMPFDHYFTQQKLFRKPWLKFTGVEPRLVYQKFGTSEIKTQNLVKSPAAIAHIVSGAILYAYSALVQFIHTSGRYAYIKITRYIRRLVSSSPNH